MGLFADEFAFSLVEFGVYTFEIFFLCVLLFFVEGFEARRGESVGIVGYSPEGGFYYRLRLERRGICYEICHLLNYILLY